MEDMLIVCIQIMTHTKIPISTAAIREQALILFDHISSKLKNPTNETFIASKGWFDRFRNRFSLHNISFTGEKASADHEVARVCPDQVRSLTAA